MDFFDVFQREFIAKVLAILVKKLIIKEVLNSDKMSLMILRMVTLAGPTDSRRVAIVS